MDVGGRIKHFREKKGITVNRLAYLSGVSQSYLRDIELGKKQPTVEYLEYICFGLGISLKKFFDVEDNGNLLLDSAEKLDENQKKLLADFLNSLWNLMKTLGLSHLDEADVFFDWRQYKSTPREKNVEKEKKLNLGKGNAFP